ncbi:hypothetical protein L596_022747 [Steinernema carpocapsae]|uniref:Uncharacterized protein n=1 Tax=Steinernema carpocapsae TaxID=34508 RepID=A0A4U5MML6_STECR|nr:hypothetical protein L596_022747 [Steinernema carpocapsae]
MTELPFEASIFVCWTSLVAFVLPTALLICGKKKAPPAAASKSGGKSTPAVPSAPGSGAQPDSNATSKQGADLKPKQLPQTDKEAQIAKGQKRGSGDYPTMDDVVSDWSSSEEGSDGKKKEKKPKDGKKKGGKKKGGKKKSKDDRDSGKSKQGDADKEKTEGGEKSDAKTGGDKSDVKSAA